MQVPLLFCDQVTRSWPVRDRRPNAGHGPAMSGLSISNPSNR
jgi:hypothetical protein